MIFNDTSCLLPKIISKNLVDLGFLILKGIDFSAL